LAETCLPAPQVFLALRISRNPPIFTAGGFVTKNQSQIETVRGRRGIRIRLTGDIELAMAGDLYRVALELGELDGDGEIDCRRLGHLSGAGLQVLAALAVHLHAKGRKLRAVAAPPRVRPLLEMAGLSFGADRKGKD
jgi:anti-anti-sigma regulatory factor